MNRLQYAAKELQSELDKAGISVVHGEYIVAFNGMAYKLSRDSKSSEYMKILRDFIKEANELKKTKLLRNQAKLF